MAFFDDLGRKLSPKGQSTVRSANDISDVSDINKAIEQENKIIENNFYQIGRLYYATHASDADPDFLPLISAIRVSERQIAEYQQQIQRLRGMVQCPQCSAFVREAPFCTRCGSPLPRVLNTLQCRSCGHTISPGTKFCTRCGTPIEQQPSQSGIICEKCSSLIAPGATFCSCCGTAVDVKTDSSEDVQFTLEIRDGETQHDTDESDVQEKPAAFEDDRSESETDEEYLIKCSNCGEVIEPGSLFCTCCGIRIGEDGRAEESDFKVCAKCGALVNQYVVFCTECGARF